jgi:hypothetical protein
MALSPELLTTEVDSWPPAERGSAADFMAALKAKSVGGVFPTPSSECLSLRPDGSGGFQYQHGGFRKRVWANLPSSHPPSALVQPINSYAIIDEAHRAIYVANLKSASSTIT